LNALDRVKMHFRRSGPVDGSGAPPLAGEPVLRERGPGRRGEQAPIRGNQGGTAGGSSRP
jgi:hypothetical protein